MRTYPCLLLAGLAVFFITPSVLRADDPVIIHEWGTFTSLQDEQGNAIGGINIDDEPVPYFVSQVAIGAAAQYSTDGWRNLGLPPYREGKGWTAGDPSVTMRLETPVIYIYPPTGVPPQLVPPLDAHVDFDGGVLSQFYPHADFSGLPLLRFPGQPQDNIFPYVDKTTGITQLTKTSLDWKNVRLGTTEKPIETEDKVWTTPREVSAPVLQVNFSAPDFAHPGKRNAYTQAEHFLFYRGVGHLDSPISLIIDPHNSGEKDQFYVYPNLRKAVPLEIAEDAVYHQAWLTEIRADGACAFRTCPQFGGLQMETRMSPFTSMKSRFESSDFSPDNLAKLKTSMHEALVKEGLYGDEATAMLKTWELSYFKSPGLRFFYLVPRAWTDKILPLKITGASTNITRVMVGRIELVTDAQRAALARLTAGPCPDLASVKKAAQDALAKGAFSDQEKDAFYRGDKPLSELGITIPPLVQDYLSLGRFRDALIVHEQQKHPSMALAQFIKDNQLVPQQN